MGRVWTKLRQRLKDELDLECEERFTRTYAGHWQRSRGAWSWQAYLAKASISVGSQWSMTELLKAKKLVKYSSLNQIDIEIIPEECFR